MAIGLTPFPPFRFSKKNIEISSLPDCLLLSIFSFLSVIDLSACTSLLSHRMEMLSSHNVLWKQHYIRNIKPINDALNVENRCLFFKQLYNGTIFSNVPNVTLINVNGLARNLCVSETHVFFSYQHIVSAINLHTKQREANAYYPQYISQMYMENGELMIFDSSWRQYYHPLARVRQQSVKRNQIFSFHFIRNSTSICLHHNKHKYVISSPAPTRYYYQAKCISNKIAALLALKDGQFCIEINEFLPTTTRYIHPITSKKSKCVIL